MSGRGRTFVVYYGWLSDGAEGGPNAAARRIIAAGVPLLIAHTHTAPPQVRLNLTPAVLGQLEAAGTAVYGYVATGFGERASAQIECEVDVVLSSGAHGVFLDEVDPLVSDLRLSGYERLAKHLRTRGVSTIANPGVARCSRIWLDLADRLMVEHQWRSFAGDCFWARGVEPERLMAVSSDEERAMGYAMTETQAVEDTREAWAAGFGWHSSTTRYTVLPDWFESYKNLAEQ